MSSIHQDLLFLNEAVPVLKDYLLSNELYWPLSGSLPRLTPGALLLALARLSGNPPAEAQSLERQVESLRVKWRTAWETKAAREVSNRLRLWSQYLSDYMGAPDQNMDSYRTEVRGRTILQLLLADLPDAPEVAALDELDNVLKAHLVIGDFLWGPEFESAFPKDKFWFLYGSL